MGPKKPRNVVTQPISQPVISAAAIKPKEALGFAGSPVAHAGSPQAMVKAQSQSTIQSPVFVNQAKSESKPSKLFAD